MAYQENPDKQRAISRAVAMNNASQIVSRWIGQAEKVNIGGRESTILGGEIVAENISGFTISIAERLYEWLSKKEPIPLDPAVKEVVKHFSKGSKGDQKKQGISRTSDGT